MPSGCPVAFTPKGGCPLKPTFSSGSWIQVLILYRSIHPQGWVPIETTGQLANIERRVCHQVAFTPKGGCPLKRPAYVIDLATRYVYVAFTPKGGCPLKLCQLPPPLIVGGT